MFGFVETQTTFPHRCSGDECAICWFVLWARRRSEGEWALRLAESVSGYPPDRRRPL
jgi:hypothetical protein